MITGFTSHKLDLVSTYDKNNPFQIGVNGVTNVEYDPTNLTAITKVYYTIGNVDYITDYRKNVSISNSRQPYGSQFPTIFKTTIS